MAQPKDKSVGASGRAPKPAAPSLRLVRTETRGRDGIMLCYAAGGGREETWLLEQTSSQEFLALLLKGRMRQGRRIVADAEITIEPPEQAGGQPLLCMAMGPLESCTPLDIPTLRALRVEIDRLLRRPD